MLRTAMACAAIALSAAPARAQAPSALPALQPLPPALAPGPIRSPEGAAAEMRCPGTGEGVATGAVGGALVGWIFSYGLIALSGSTDEPVQRGRRWMIAGGAVLGAVRGGITATRCQGGANGR